MEKNNNSSPKRRKVTSSTKIDIISKNASAAVTLICIVGILVNTGIIVKAGLVAILISKYRKYKDEMLDKKQNMEIGENDLSLSETFLETLDILFDMPSENYKKSQGFSASSEKSNYKGRHLK